LDQICGLKEELKAALWPSKWRLTADLVEYSLSGGQWLTQLPRNDCNLAPVAWVFITVAPQTTEFEHAPIVRLWSDPIVLITPHISATSDNNRHRLIDLFCDKLRACLDGRPLRNVVDWEPGYCFLMAEVDNMKSW
jgi:hypothetical protein